jgi:Asp-tRNA(Asn)/Glu-tRNA(Gln) amidotransferase B subunit
VPSTRLTRASVLGIVTVAGLLLTGCAAGQSTAEACTIVQTTMDKAQQDLSESVASFGSDPVKGADAVDDLVASFSSANDKISNPEVKKATDAAEKALGAFAGEMRTAAEDPANVDSKALTDALGGIQTTFADVQTACTA